MTRNNSDHSGPSCCPAPSFWGWSPAPLAADTRWKRRVDRFLPRTGLPAMAYFASVAVLVLLALRLPLVLGLAVNGLAALAAGGWCALNFWRCRHAHCVVTGVGWLGLALLCFTEAALGRSLIAGSEGLLFLGVLVAGLAFEGGWFLARGDNALRSQAPGDAGHAVHTSSSRTSSPGSQRSPHADSRPLNGRPTRTACGRPRTLDPDGNEIGFGGAPV